MLEGYSIFLPVPSDLPLFYKMALQVISRQSLTHVNEIVVIPDRDTPAFAAVVAETGSTIGNVPLVYCGNRPFATLVSRLYGRPSFLYAMQVIRGLTQARSKYALLHDADLFLFDNSFIERQYETMSTRHLNALGVNRSWDPWYAENGLEHVTATWELMLSTDWARSFPPVLLTPHTNTVVGQRHKFDVLLYAQCLTKSETIDTVPVGSELVHFNYVIGTYRNFTQSLRRFVDERFIIMLLRILIDAYDPDGDYRRVPPWNEILGALRTGHPRLAFPSASVGGAAYLQTRSKIVRFLDLPLVSETLRQSITRRLAQFDDVYLEARSPEAQRLDPLACPA